MIKANSSKEGDAKPSELNSASAEHVSRAAVSNNRSLPFCLSGGIMSPGTSEELEKT